MLVKTCNLCKVNKTEEGCAFKTGVFNPDNYRCATALRLRESIFRHYDNGTKLRLKVHFNNDEWWTVIPLDDIDIIEIDYDSDEPMPDSPTAIYAGWYKNRGKISQIQVLYNDESPRPATEDEVLKVIKYLDEAK